MNKIDGSGKPKVAKSRGGEQFADPLAWNPDQRPAGPPPPRGGGGPGIDAQELREKEINRRILQEYGRGPLDALKPLMGVALIGLIVWVNVDKHNMWNAIVYCTMAMGAGGSVALMVGRDSTPPLVSLIMKGFFALGLLSIGAWFLMNHLDTFKRPLDKDDGPRFKQVADPTAN